MKALKILKLWIHVYMLVCFCVLIQTCPRSSSNSCLGKIANFEKVSFYKELKNKLRISILMKFVKKLNLLLNGIKEQWSAGKIFSQPIDPIIFDERLSSVEIARLNILPELISFREEFLRIKNKEGYGQIYQEALPLWIFCEAMAQFKKDTGSYILYESKKNQCNFASKLDSLMIKMKGVVTPLFNFIKSVNKIDTQNYQD